jgi:hypothetical protein
MEEKQRIYFGIYVNKKAAKSAPIKGPTTGIQAYFQSLLPLVPIGKTACMILGARSLTGLMA